MHDETTRTSRQIARQALKEVKVERRWLLKRQASGLNVVLGPSDTFNGVNPGEQVWVVPERQLQEAEKALLALLDRLCGEAQ